MFRTRFLLCLALGIAIQAAPRPRLGFEAHLDAPLGDLKTDLGGKIGGGLSFLASFELGPNLVLRPRAEVDVHPVSSYHRAGSHYQQRVGLNSAGLGADLLGVITGGRDHGLYWLAGAGAQQWFQSFTTSDYTSSSSDTHTETKKNKLSPWGALGLGWQLNRLVGLELREVVSRYDSPQGAGLQAPFNDVPTEARTSSSLQAGVTFRW